MSNVVHPHHYNDHPSGVEVMDYVCLLPFGPGNAVKYIMRRDHKGKPVEDIEKAIYYLNDTIERGRTYRITPHMKAVIRPVIDAEPHPGVKAILACLLTENGNASWWYGADPDLELARDMCIALKEEYL